MGCAKRPTNYILVTIRINIRIRESVPDHDPDPGRTATLSTHTEQNDALSAARPIWPRDQVMIRIIVRI